MGLIPPDIDLTPRHAEGIETPTSMRSNVEVYKRCPNCLHEVAVRYTHDLVRNRQGEERKWRTWKRWVRHVTWQCLWNEHDNGWWEVAVDDPQTPLGEEITERIG